MVSRYWLEDIVVVQVCRSFNLVMLVSQRQALDSAGSAGNSASLDNRLPAPAAPASFIQSLRFTAILPFFEWAKLSHPSLRLAVINLTSCEIFDRRFLISP